MHQPTADFSADELWAETILRLIAEDAAQPVLADGKRPAYIIRYRGLVQLLNYFIVIAKRIAIGRKRRMKPTLSLSAGSEEETAHDVPEDAPTPAQHAQASQDAIALRQAISAAYSRLSPEQRFLIAMVYRNGMKQKEAGTLLGWSEFKTCGVWRPRWICCGNRLNNGRARIGRGIWRPPGKNLCKNAGKTCKRRQGKRLRKPHRIWQSKFQNLPRIYANCCKKRRLELR
jgi:DNA-directed RNA polymerase specialized sigma24 family protein